MGWTGRQIDLQIGVRLDRVVDDFRIRTLSGRRPNRKPELTSRFQDTKRFGASALRVGKMKQSKVSQNTIEAAIDKRQVLGVALPKVDLRKHLLRDRDHFARKIKTCRNCGVLRGSG